MQRLLALSLSLIVGFVLFLGASLTPRPQPDSAPRGFSALRALEDVRLLGATPHPIGSPEHDRVRDRLIARMRDLGLQPQVESGSSFETGGPVISGGAVANVIGTLPGRDRSAPALALMAHYDSVWGSPGAADDTAGVAAALEIVRVLKSRGRPLRDVELVITDGEEAGLLGARLFFDDPRLAGRVGYVINMETRGGGGRAAMFETAPRNGGDIALFARTAVMPDSNALTVFVYKRLPNDTDFTVALQHGAVGLNYAFIGRQFDYHSPSSTPEALDLGSLQHMGQEVLGTAAALAFGPLPPRAPDRVYSDVLGLGVLSYPPWFGWVILAATAVLIAVGAWRARGRGLGVADLARGAGCGVYVIALSGALLELARRATGVGSGWMAYRPILARFGIFEVMMLSAALGGLLLSLALSPRPRSRLLGTGAALIAGIGCSAFGGLDEVGLGLGAAGAIAALLAFGGPARLPGSWTGALVLGLGAAALAQASAPAAAFLFAWPLAAAAAASALTGAGSARGPLSLLVQAIAATASFAWVGGVFHEMLQALDLPALAIIPTWLAGFAAWPLASAVPPERPRLWPAGSLIGLAAILAACLRLTDPWSPRHPNAAEPVYVVDPAERRAWRASLTPPDAWTLRAMRAEGGAASLLSLAFRPTPVPAAAAAFEPAAPAPVALSLGPGDRVTLKAGISPGASRLFVSFSSKAPIDGVSLDGKAVVARRRDQPPQPFVLRAGEAGMVVWGGGEGYDLSFHTADPSSVKVKTAEVYDGWRAARPLPPMPPTDQAWDMAGSTIVLGEATPRR